jgi:hypothetical protein
VPPTSLQNRDGLLVYGRGAGVGRCLGVGRGLGVHGGP